MPNDRPKVAAPKMFQAQKSEGVLRKRGELEFVASMRPGERRDIALAEGSKVPPYVQGPYTAKYIREAREMVTSYRSAEREWMGKRQIEARRNRSMKSAPIQRELRRSR